MSLWAYKGISRGVFFFFYLFKIKILTNNSKYSKLFPHIRILLNKRKKNSKNHSEKESLSYN